MNVIGIRFKRPSIVGLMASTLMAALCLLAGLLFSRLVGGSVGQAAGLSSVGLVVGLLSVCGASFDKAGPRGLLLTTVAGTATFVAVVAAFGIY